MPASASPRLVGIAVAGVWYLVLQEMIGTQQERNAYLSTEIKKLEEQIKDIATLKAEIESLKARQKAVEDLQTDRNCRSRAQRAREADARRRVLHDDQAGRPAAHRIRHRADQRACLRVPAQHRQHSEWLSSPSW
jgi:citrate synthase